MDSLRITGELTTNVSIRVNARRQCKEASFLVSVPILHEYVQSIRPDCRTTLKVIVGNDSEWAYDYLYEGAHVEIKSGKLTTWYAGGRNQYHILATDIDKERSIEVPDDYTPINLIRLSGYFMNQFCDREMPDGTRRLGITMNVVTSVREKPSSSSDFMSILLFGDMADKIAGKLKYKDRIEYVEGSIQSYKGSKRNGYNILINATRFDI